MDLATRCSSGEDVYCKLQSRLSLPAIPALDGIRAICVFLVIFYHLSNERNLPVVPGPLGVLGFFVLSGFLITRLLIKEQEKFGSISLKGFYRRRAIRIADRIPGLNTPAFVAIAVFIGIALSSCSYYLVERPFLAMKTKRSVQPRAASMPLVTPIVYKES